MPSASLAAPGSRLGYRLVLPFLLLLPATLFLVPLLAGTAYLARYSLNGWDPVAGMQPDVSLGAYVKFLSEPFFRRALLDTFRLAFIVTVLAAVLGYPVAYLMVRRPRYRNLILLLIILPLLTDVVVRAYGWIVLFGSSGLVNSTLLGLGVVDRPVRIIFTETAVVAELLHETLAYMILPIAAVLQKIGADLPNAARTLGASRWKAFWLVTFPLSLPGLLAGTLLVFALGISAFVGPLVLGGGNVTVMSLLIRNQVGVILDWPLGSAMSIVLVILTLVLLFLYGRALRSSAQTEPAMSGRGS